MCGWLLKSETTQRTFCTEFSCVSGENSCVERSLSCSDFSRDADFCTEFSCVSGENSCVEVVSAFSSFAGAKRFLYCLKSETTRRAFCTEFSCVAEKTLVLNVSVFELF